MIQVARHWRWWGWLLCFFCCLNSAGPWVSRVPYQAPIFETVRRVAPWPVWSAVWAIAGTLAFLGAYTRKPAFWRAGLISSIWVAFFWFLGVTWEHWVDGELLSLTGWGLWIFFCTANFLIATSKSQYSRTEDR